MGWLFVLPSLTMPAAAQHPARRPAPRAAPRPADHWIVDTSRSEMTDEPSVILYLRATNEVQGVLLDVQPVLFIRCHERNADLFINSGSVLDGDAEGNTAVRIRWGTDAPVEDQWSRSTDYEAAFAPDPPAFIRQLIAAPEMRFEFHPFDAAPRVAIFDARGLANHLPLITAACPSIAAPPAHESASKVGVGIDSVFTQAVVDEQPELASAPKVDYPALLRSAGIQGRVMVEAIIDTSGRAEPQSLHVIQSPNPGFNPPAMDYVRQCVFRPGRVHGRVVRVLLHVPVDFRMNR